MQTWHIHIKGQVQGVGFRPFVYRLAKEHRLNGWVNNTIDGVHIEINASEEDARQFCSNLLRQAPALSIISSHQLEKTAPQEFPDFRILHSDATGQANLLLTPDFAMCPDCRQELWQSENRRAAYPFITCTNCGPRFSITRQLPYDRETTTMTPFIMCPDCQYEYNEPADRRYYSQTNSCPVCTINLQLYQQNTPLQFDNQSALIDAVVQEWKQGKIVAIKGIGGYLLTCDATHEPAIRELRKRKHRPTKPFAMMYPGLEMLAEDTKLRAEEKKSLTGIAAPIVLLQVKPNMKTPVCRNEIAPGLVQIGVMLPYTPLYDLLLKKFGKPIVATSGNISHAPIVYDDQKALAELPRIADSILINNREIVVPQDDSVVRYSHFSKQKVIIRRSRGLAPGYINPDLDLPSGTLLATGAMMKSSFTFLHQGNTFISQYLGDLEHFDTQENYRHTVRHFFRLFNDKPEVVLTDKHPLYASTQYGESLAAELQIPHHKYQHHMAHFAAILGEHNLVHTEEPVLGVIWDGTGLGNDGQIWGGEVFTYQNYNFRRQHHFSYFDFILGDKMPREPRISALTATWGVQGANELLRPKFSSTEWGIYTHMLSKGSKLKTSSLGRIFDAVACLLGIMDKASYEGEAAMLLEQAASRYFLHRGLELPESYFVDAQITGTIPTPYLMEGVVKDLQTGNSPEYIAARFHASLAGLIPKLAGQTGIYKVAFSGGVFQNSLLNDLILHLAGDELELYFHKELSPNDENVSFGQLICYLIKNNENKNEN